MNSTLTTATTVTQSGEFKKTNTFGVESWSGNTPCKKENKQMKISRVHKVWVLRIQERHFYFPSFLELMNTVRNIVDSL